MMQRCHIVQGDFRLPRATLLPTERSGLGIEVGQARVRNFLRAKTRDRVRVHSSVRVRFDRIGGSSRNKQRDSD